MPKAGMVVQMDSSQHRWLEGIKDPWWLLAMIDDADGFVLRRVSSKRYSKGQYDSYKSLSSKEMAFYTDRASHFKTTRHGGLHYHLEVEQKETQIERALGELGIKLINTNTPQAKGRIERKFRFFQDRLIKKMRLGGIKNYEEANRFLKEEFLFLCNKRYTFEVESLYRPLPQT
ncbi:MAG: hypothetical protein LDL13_05800 [Calditerrivibrio sp.]|nr:hypothetical protein [Calditerrivibrio sp.]MCA1979992.1 hypothetical protein [Calditerrivibrio sp.]